MMDCIESRGWSSFTMENPDVAVIGGGIGGSAMAIVLARAGFNVLMLEKTRVHKDVTRGEWLSPWGVLEANHLGLTSLYEADGAHRIDRHITYSDVMSAEDAEGGAIDLAAIVPERPLCIGHPRCCDLLNDDAERLGVKYLRGITALQVIPGTPPTLQFTHNSQSHELTPRLIIGADGRNGIVAKQIGATLSHDEEHHLFSGMLVEDAHDWPEDVQVIACEGDVNVLAFPQGAGRVRIYLGWPSSDRGRLVGPDGPAHFLQSWQIDCVPGADVIANAIPASPCIAYPNHDAWLDFHVCDGVVLIGDAAGRNDPIIGQGLSITHRDVRMVSDAMLQNERWSTDIFDDYVEERRQRMARLRITARLTSLRESAFGEDGRRLRQQIHERIAAAPELALPFAAGFVGPENLPEEAFTPAFLEQIVGEPIWNALP
jgi:2-polyprenyl-6-methoxyphenol hydroxylase-like FAD-dependent oxidoreductase